MDNLKGKTHTIFFKWLNGFLKKILPNWIYKRIIGNWDIDGLEKYFYNTGWIFGSRVLSFTLSFFMVAIVARYLGPENLGKLSYAQSLISILSVFALLGIDQIIYRDLTAHPEKEKEILGTALLSKLFFGSITLIIALIVSTLLNNDPVISLLVGIIAFTFLINPIGIIGIFFQSKVKAKYTSQITIFLAFFIPALKLIVIYFNKGIIYFAFILLVEATIVSAWSLYIYITKFHSSPFNWRFHITTFVRLIKDSWPFLFAGLFGYIYARIDQVMLQYYLGSTSVGLYDSAVKLTNIWSFFPGIIIGSLFPAIINAKKISRILYLKRYATLAIFTSIIALSITIPIFIFSKPIVLIVFGEKFVDTISVLRIYIWSGVLAILGVLVQQYLVTENKGKTYLILVILGAVVNVTLNLYTIPHYGILGAAASTIFSYAIVPLGLLFTKQFRKDIFDVFFNDNNKQDDNI